MHGKFDQRYIYNRPPNFLNGFEKKQKKKENQGLKHIYNRHFLMFDIFMTQELNYVFLREI